MSAFNALAQMHPPGAFPQAVLAAIVGAGRDLARLVEVGAGPVGGLAASIPGDHPTAGLLAHGGSSFSKATHPVGRRPEGDTCHPTGEVRPGVGRTLAGTVAWL